MKTKIALVIIAVGSFLIMAFTPPKKEKQEFVTAVCNSASNSKKIIDTYMALGYRTESITTQIISVMPKGNGRIDFWGGSFEREYLIILTK